MGTRVEVGIEVSLADFRAAIRIKWLPLVGRTQLNRQEYELTEEWYEEGVLLSHVLMAIQRLEKRVKRSHITVYSLGVLRADLAAVQRDQGSRQASAHSDQANWKLQFSHNLYNLMQETDNPELRAMYSELRSDILEGNLTLEAAKDRWEEIKTKG